MTRAAVRRGAAALPALVLVLLLALVFAPPLHAREPLPWFEGTDGGAAVRSAVALLADAPSHGLEPADYGLPALQDAVAQTLQGSAPAATAPLARALTEAMERYLHDLHDGRVSPRELDHRFKAAPRDPFDAAEVLRAAFALQDLPQAVKRAAPSLPQYQRLREALVQYRALADHPAWQQPLPAAPAVAARLAALGDLSPAAAMPARLDDVALASAVKAFQQRHGLMPDGTVGRATRAALQVTPLQRARQIELSLERLRWTPLLQGPRMIVVNIPEFVLRAYEVRGERIALQLEMKVIVGNALDTRTPLIDEQLRRIEFKPHWNVPASIARNEIVPRLRREPAYWAREGFEFVDRAGGVDAVLAQDKLAAVLAGRLRIRQRAGPRNPLGDIKFVFPNRESIYLHHTPSVRLFERARRDFSHGCIRVQQPVALARFALQGLPGWSEERIGAAMAHGEPAAVALAQPVPVLIAYATALVKDARVHFFEDLYGHDRALDAALRAGESARRLQAER